MKISQRTPYVPPTMTSWQQLTAGRLGRRVPQLIFGLFLYGWSMAMMIESGLGLDPWDVFHQGLANFVPLSFGGVVIAVGAAVLVVWIPLRQWPGLGTILNVIVIGLAADLGLAVIDQPDALSVRIAMLVLGIVLNGLAGALYIGTHLGAGPRDGITLGLVTVTGLSVRVIRTGVEIVVLAIGFVLGGTLGIGTAMYALAIGPLLQFFLAFSAVSLDTTRNLDERGNQVDESGV